MAVALVDSRVRRQKVIVVLAVYIPYVHALSSLQDHRNRGIVVRAMLVLSFNILRQELQAS